jgi:hypothetical protein
VVGRLDQDVGGDGAGDPPGVGPVFGEGFLVVLEDADDALGGLRADTAVAEHVAGEGSGLFQEIDRPVGAVGQRLGDQQRNRAGTDMNRGHQGSGRVGGGRVRHRRRLAGGEALSMTNVVP